MSSRTGKQNVKTDLYAGNKRKDYKGKNSLSKTVQTLHFFLLTSPGERVLKTR